MFKKVGIVLNMLVVLTLSFSLSVGLMGCSPDTVGTYSRDRESEESTERLTSPKLTDGDLKSPLRVIVTGKLYDFGRVFQQTEDKTEQDLISVGLQQGDNEEYEIRISYAEGTDADSVEYIYLKAPETNLAYNFDVTQREFKTVLDEEEAAVKYAVKSDYMIGYMKNKDKVVRVLFMNKNKTADDMLGVFKSVK